MYTCACVRTRVCTLYTPPYVYTYIYIILPNAAAAASAEGCQMVKLAPETRPFYTPHPVDVVVGSGRPARRSSGRGVRHVGRVHVRRTHSPARDVHNIHV